MSSVRKTVAFVRGDPGLTKESQKKCRESRSENANAGNCN